MYRTKPSLMSCCENIKIGTVGAELNARIPLLGAVEILYTISETVLSGSMLRSRLDVIVKLDPSSIAKFAAVCTNGASFVAVTDRV